MSPLTTKYMDGFATISEIADVLPVQSYKKLEKDSTTENHKLKLFIKKNIALDDNVGRLSFHSEFDYAIFNSSEPLLYISFILNSKFGFNSIGKSNQWSQSAIVSLSRIKDTIVPLNDHMDDCCYFEKIHTLVWDHYLRLNKNAKEEEEDKKKYFFFLEYLYTIKSYMILEMFKPEIFREYDFSILKSWSIEREILGNLTPNLSLANKLLKSLYSRSNELVEDIKRLGALRSHYDFSPII